MLMMAPVRVNDGAELASNAGNLAAVLATWRDQHPSVLAALEGEFCRLVPEFGGIALTSTAEGTVQLGARLRDDGQRVVTADNLSQGTLYLLAMLTLAFVPRPPAVVCIEEADRGLHPRSLREVRDALYRLSYPRDAGLERAPV